MGDNMQDLPPDPPTAEQAEPSPTLTDLGNSRVLVNHWGEDYRWCGAMPGTGWMVWTGAKWEPDDTKRIMRTAMQVGGYWRARAADAEDDDTREAMSKHAARSESATAIRHAIELASAHPRIAMRRERFDADHMLFATPGATYDLRTVRQHAPRREDYITRIGGVSAASRGDCPTWVSFLDRIMGGDEDMVAFLQRVIGYCLTGSTDEQCMFVLYGRGANGKSTFMNLLMHLLGDYAKQTPVETFTARREGGIPNDLAALAGARLVSCSESQEGAALEEGVVKLATGSDPIPARFLNREFFSYVPTFKLFMLTNHKPIIRGTDDGIWRRLRLIPFTVTIPKEQRDPLLMDKLKAEAPAILRWALDGFKAWREQGLNPPAAVVAATDDYRRDMDVLAEFLGERCAVEDGARADNGELYRSYAEWAKDNGQHPKSAKSLARALKDRGFEQGRGDARYWAGLRLVTFAKADVGGLPWRPKVVE